MNIERHLELVSKTIKVIRSCKTPSQISTATDYARLAMKMIKREGTLENAAAAGVFFNNAFSDTIEHIKKGF